MDASLQAILQPGQACSEAASTSMLAQFHMLTSNLASYVITGVRPFLKQSAFTGCCAGRRRFRDIFSIACGRVNPFVRTGPLTRRWFSQRRLAMNRPELGEGFSRSKDGVMA